MKTKIKNEKDLRELKKQLETKIQEKENEINYSKEEA
jgi:hypothetical protein